MLKRVVLNALLILGGSTPIILPPSSEKPVHLFLLRRAILLQRDVQNFIDAFDRDEFEFLFCFLWNIDKIFFVELWDDDRGNPRTHRRKAFFFQTADRQNQTAQSDFASHGDIRPHGSITERGESREHSNSR